MVEEQKLAVVQSEFDVITKITTVSVTTIEQQTIAVKGKLDSPVKNPQRKSANWLRTIIWMFSMMFAFNIFAALIVYFFMAPK